MTENGHDPTQVQPEEVETSQIEASDENAATEQGPGTVNADDHARLLSEKEELSAQLMRTMADFQNFRKRVQQEAIVNRQYATESLVMTLLPVLDNFERTVLAASSGATLESMLEGVKAVEKQFRFIIEEQGVQRLDLVGKPFDANEAEAIATIATADHAPDTVVEELEPGYRMGGKVIRPARVKVSVAP